MRRMGVYTSSPERVLGSVWLQKLTLCSRINVVCGKTEW